MGSRRYSCARIVSRKAVGFGLSSGVGALGMHQAAAVAARWKELRPAVTDRAALRCRRTKRHALRVALQQSMPDDAPGHETPSSAARAGDGALELRWMAHNAGYEHP